MSFFSFISKNTKERLIMLSILLLVLECLKELFFIILVGSLTCIFSGIMVIYVVTKVLGIATILDMEDEEDYILTKDDEKIPYDDETQE